MRKLYPYFLTIVLIIALSMLYVFSLELKEIKLKPKKTHNTELNKFGVWLWYLHKTGYKTHEDLSYALAELGAKRIFVKVANGRDLIRWPELRNRNVSKAYERNNIEAWAWSYNYPGNEKLQAEALYYAAKYGYKSFIVDIEKEFDGRPDAADALFKAFYEARQRAIQHKLIDSTFKIYCTTWGNPRSHYTPIASINKYVDGFMPQTYVEVWGDTHLDNIPYWIKSGTNEYKDLGATKPLYHIASTELDKMTAEEINEFLKYAGTNASIWRIPGGGVPTAVWKDWQKVNWDLSFNDSITRANPFMIINQDTTNKFFSVNYLGNFVKIKVLDSTGFETKEVRYSPKNAYAINDLCKEKYCIEIYHATRKTCHVLDLR